MYLKLKNVTHSFQETDMHFLALQKKTFLIQK